ncbi:MAG: hypothetical protein ABI855_09770, partial [Bacteroidota bacterium]
MKKILIIIYILVVCIQLSFNVNGQSTIPGNASGIPLQSLGWWPVVGSTPKNLDIVNGHPLFNINFFTNAGAGPAWANPRMQIYENGGALAGNVAIGNFNTFIPQSQLHLHSAGHVDDWLQITTPISGTPPANRDGLRIGVIENTQEAQFKQQENAPMEFITGDGAPIIVQRERFRLFYGSGGDGIGGWNNINGVTKAFISHDGIGVNYLPASVAMLNIGSNTLGASGGRRRWMDVGTYYDFDSDNMYVGLKDVGRNQKNAVINWGDDPYLNPDTRNEYLLFNFTSFLNNGGTNDAYDFGTVDGMEVARMTASGTMGIGSTFTTLRPPQARLDIFDDQTAHGLYHPGLPQLRLTQTQDPNATLGTWTDFTTNINPIGYTVNNIANLYIHPSSDLDVQGIPVEGRVGINTPYPENTLEINATGDPLHTYVPGVSGLRFNDLNPTSTPIAPNGTVLTVNATGDVVLTDDGFSSCGVGNYLPKVDPANTARSICSQVFDNGTTVSIGTYPPANSLFYNFEVAGQSVFSLTGNTTG